MLRLRMIRLSQKRIHLAAGYYGGGFGSQARFAKMDRDEAVCDCKFNLLL